MIQIFFHYQCQDGLTCAWVIVKYIQKLIRHFKNGEEVEIPNKKLYYDIKDYCKTIDGIPSIKKLFNIIELKPINHNMYEYQFDSQDKHVIFADITPLSLKYDIEFDNLMRFFETCTRSFIIIDHHISTKQFKENFIFDNQKCGAVLCWEYFMNTEVPLFIQMIQDKDLWTWTNPQSQYFTSGLSFVLNEFHDYDFNKLLNKYDQIEENFDEIIKTGKLITIIRERKIKNLAKKCKKIENILDQTYRVIFANCDLDYASELGNYLVEKNNIDFSIIWIYDHRQNEYVISLRSKEVDVSVIAKDFGGGGHKNASGLKSKHHPIKLFK